MIFLNSGNGTLSPLTQTIKAISLVSGDFNEDGHIDCIFGTFGAKNQVWIGKYLLVLKLLELMEQQSGKLS